MTVVVTGHAVKRLRKRAPALAGPTSDTAIAFIEKLVKEALAARRVAKRAPMFTARERAVGKGRRSRTDGPQHVRFVWDEDEQAAAVVKRVRKVGSAVTWLVITVVVPDTDV